MGDLFFFQKVNRIAFRVCKRSVHIANSAQFAPHYALGVFGLSCRMQTHSWMYLLGCGTQKIRGNVLLTLFSKVLAALLLQDI